LFGWQE
jgi:hypothetical protein